MVSDPQTTEAATSRAFNEWRHLTAENRQLFVALESLAQAYCHQGGNQTRHEFMEASSLLTKIRRERGER
jgi:hypothetical protein